jgi:hypothetical protein
MPERYTDLRIEWDDDKYMDMEARRVQDVLNGAWRHGDSPITVTILPSPAKPSGAEKAQCVIDELSWSAGPTNREHAERLYRIGVLRLLGMIADKEA